MKHCNRICNRRAIALLLAFVMTAALFLTGCENTQSTSANAKVEQQAFPFVFMPTDKAEPEEREMNLYFVDGGTVPYVALSEYMPFFGSLYENDESANLTALEFAFNHEYGIYTVERTDSEWQMAISPEYDSILFNSYDAFIASPSDNSLIPLVNIGENGLGGYNLLKDSGTSYDRQGYGTEFDLSKFHIDIVEANGECYLPLQTMQDIFLSRAYYVTIYNGEKVFIFPYGVQSLNEQIYGVEPAEMSEDYASFNANELAFLIDTFYGLKPEHGIDDVYSFFANTGRDFYSTNPQTFDSSLNSLVSLYFDDGHSGYIHGSCGVDESAQSLNVEEFISNFGSSSEKSFNNAVKFGTIRKQYIPGFKHPWSTNKEEKPVYDYTEIGDTAIVTFDAFTINKTDYYQDADLENPADTIELVMAAHKQIMREGSPVKNVVVDLSCNGGGNAGAAAFIIAWITGGKQIALRNTATGALSALSYIADVNLDGEFDQNDSLQNKLTNEELNVYCMTAPNSFSCGNLVPSSLKGLYGITLIGQRSGGGSCVVHPCTSASGAQFQISGPLQISTIVNGSFYNADTGIEVDVPIRNLETMYDRNKLIDFIHNIM